MSNLGQSKKEDNHKLVPNSTDDMNKPSTSRTLNLPTISRDNLVAKQFEDELKCSICMEVFICAVTLNCSHSFCQYCITKWREEHSKCPICREMIHSQNSSLVLDNCVEKLLESCGEEAKMHRREIIECRENHKEHDPQLSPSDTDDETSYIFEDMSPTPSEDEQTQYLQWQINSGLYRSYSPVTFILG